ncbi:MAG: hypothetical protein JOZ65_03955 [Chloroflexi bacterium]|nr:hypothetical protein [Chloroflexota bacterium]
MNRFTCAQLGHRAPTGDITMQRAQMGVSHRPQRNTVSILGCRAQRKVSLWPLGDGAVVILALRP